MKNKVVFDMAVMEAYHRANQKYPINLNELDTRNDKIRDYVREFVNRNVWICLDNGEAVTKHRKNELLETKYEFDEFTPMSEQFEYFMPIFDYADAYGDTDFTD